MTTIMAGSSATSVRTGPLTRAAAVGIVEEFVKNQNLRRHMLATEAAMRAYALKFHEDPEVWGLVGLLHDFDWEIHPTLDMHPVQGQSLLAERGVPLEIRQAILAHAPHTGVPATNLMEKSILAVDELTGFIVACALVSPRKLLADVTVIGIKKKLKSKSFAANVSRQDISNGWSLLGQSEDEHYQLVLQAMQQIHVDLGL